MEKSQNDTTQSPTVRKMSELLKSQTNAEKQDDSSKSGNDNSVHIQYENTPLFIRKYPDSGYFATLGSHRVTDEFEKIDDLTKKIDRKDWELLLTCVSAMIHQFKNMEKEQENKAGL